MKTVGVLGSGVVGSVLSNGFLAKGYRVFRGTRTPEKLEDWLSGAGERGAVGTFSEAAEAGHLLVIAINGSAVLGAVSRLDPSALEGKVVIDTSNPVAPVMPVDGVLQYSSSINRSLMEDLQEAVPGARFVKAFSCVGSAHMVDPVFPNGPPTMFMCGNDERAREEVAAILIQFGWEVADMGSAAAARAIEPLAMLYCIPGFREESWGHAFKLLRK